MNYILRNIDSVKYKISYIYFCDFGRRNLKIYSEKRFKNDS